MRIVKRHQPYQDGWNEVEQGEMWIHARNGQWTGLQINNPRLHQFHVRFYPQRGRKRDHDLGTRPSLAKAKTLAEGQLKHVL